MKIWERKYQAEGREGRGGLFLNAAYVILSNYGPVRFGLWILQIIEHNI